MTTTTRLTDEQLQAIREGCDGVTPGPYRVFINDSGGEWSGWPLSIESEAIADKTIVRPGGIYPYSWDAKTSQHEAVANAAHIARLDPETVRAIVTELIARRAGDSAIVEACAKVAEDQMLRDDTGERDDNAYNSAASHIADAIRALALPAPVTLTEDRWLPIETAPKNGSCIWVAYNHGDWTTGEGFWRGDKWVVCAAFHKPSLPHPQIELREHYAEPLLWQPLPRGPDAILAAQRGAAVTRPDCGGVAK